MRNGPNATFLRFFGNITSTPKKFAKNSSKNANRQSTNNNPIARHNIQSPPPTNFSFEKKYNK